jgi:thiamine monophosphate kinase
MQAPLLRDRRVEPELKPLLLCHTQEIVVNLRRGSNTIINSRNLDGRRGSMVGGVPIVARFVHVVLDLITGDLVRGIVTSATLRVRRRLDDDQRGLIMNLGPRLDRRSARQGPPISTTGHHGNDSAGLVILHLLGLRTFLKRVSDGLCPEPRRQLTSAFRASSCSFSSCTRFG